MHTHEDMARGAHVSQKCSRCLMRVPPHRQMYPLPASVGTETQPDTHTHTSEPTHTQADAASHTPVHMNSVQKANAVATTPGYPASQPFFLFPILCVVLGSGAPRAQLPPGALGPRP